MYEEPFEDKGDWFTKTIDYLPLETVFGVVGYIHFYHPDIEKDIATAIAIEWHNSRG